MIWVAGSRGMLGTEVGRKLDGAGLPWVGTGHEVDIADDSSVAEFFAGRDISWVVNCAAYTAVDKAETEAALCHRTNALGPAVLARHTSAAHARLIHISTDYVFSGTGTTPYTEDDPISPLGVYGKSKAEGEQAVRELCQRHFIFRTAWLYGASGPNFVYTMLKLMSRRGSLGVVADQWGSPTWAADLAGVIAAVVQREPESWGTYHASGEGLCTWHGFAQAILDEARSRGLVDPGKVFELIPLTTDQYPTPAKRPGWSVLSKAKLKNVLGLIFPDWRQSLEQFLDGPLATELFEKKGTLHA